MTVFSQMIFLVIFCVTFSYALPSPSLLERQAGGDSVNGWSSLPPVDGASLRRDWPMKGATFVSVVHNQQTFES